jgi:hypothetical protein
MMLKEKEKMWSVPRRSKARGRTQAKVTVVADPHLMVVLVGF